MTASQLIEIVELMLEAAEVAEEKRYTRLAFELRANADVCLRYARTICTQRQSLDIAHLEDRMDLAVAKSRRMEMKAE